MDPLSWRYGIDALGEGRSEARVATQDECVAVAAALGIPACHTLTAQFTLTPRARGRVRVAGTFAAKVTQDCVVTLEPVSTSLDEEFEAEFRDPADMAIDEDHGNEGADHEHSALAIADEPEPIEAGHIDVGRVVYQALSAALPPYPRADGVEFAWEDAAMKEAGGPFAALAKLKKKD